MNPNRYKSFNGNVHEHFKEGIRTGKFVPLPNEEIERIVDEHYLNFEPLNPLNNGEETELRERLIRAVDGYSNNNTFKGLCRKDKKIISYISSHRCIRGYEGHKRGDLIEEPKVKIVSPENLEYELGQIERYGEPKDGKVDVRPWTDEEKLQAITDPETWTENYSSSSQRHLNEYMDEDYFKWITKFARKGLHWEGEKAVESHKNKLKVLEIGCGTGMALTDMKALDNNLETHGINLAPEFTRFPGHQFHYLTLERMPKEFNETFDYIHSHQCFRYAAYPDVGYANVLKALSIGGIAWLHLLPNDRNPLDKGGFEEGKKRGENIYKIYDNLVRDDFIRPLSRDNPSVEDIIKLKSIPEDYQIIEKE